MHQLCIPSLNTPRALQLEELYTCCSSCLEFILHIPALAIPSPLPPALAHMLVYQAFLYYCSTTQFLYLLTLDPLTQMYCLIFVL